MNKKIKVALCITGQARTFENAWQNISDSIIRPLSVYCEVDMFGVFPEVNDFISSSNWKALLIKKDTYFDFSIKMSNNTRNVPENTNGLLNMWNSWKLSNEMTKEFDQYDWVFRVRPDSFFSLEIDDLRMLEPDGVYLPKHDSWGGYNDRFAFGSASAMDCYSTLIDHCESYFDQGLQFHVESYLKHHLDKHGIPVKNCNMHLCILRPWGTQPICWDC